MKANELMIGDWASMSETDDIAPCVVTALHPEDLFVLQPEWSAGDVLSYDTIYPIPLTAEILEKNFPKGDEVAWWYADDYEDADDRITYEIHISGGAIGINGFMWYVHELQHALRLCGLNDLADSIII